MTPSLASKADVARYRTGECHIFAVALHRQFGWRIHLVLDREETFWQDPGDPDNAIPTVLHAYAIDDAGNAWDIAGVRPESEIGDDIEAWAAVGERDSDECRSEAELKMYVGCWADAEDGEPIDRPLTEYSDADVAEAAEVATRVLGGIAGFGPSADARHP